MKSSTRYLQDCLSQEIEALLDFRNRVSENFVLENIKDYFELEGEIIQQNDLLCESYPGLIEFSTCKEPKIKHKERAVVVIRKEKWILYKTLGLNSYISWCSSEIRARSWESVSQYRSVLQCKHDKSLSNALEAWIAFICGERNKDLVSNILVPEYKIEYAIEVFDEFYLEFLNAVSDDAQHDGRLAKSNIMQYIINPFRLSGDNLCHSNDLSTLFSSMKGYCENSSGAILLALFLHVLEQRPTHFKARGIKFLLPALRGIMRGLQQPRSHGLPARYHSLGVVMPFIISQLSEWEAHMCPRTRSRISATYTSSGFDEKSVAIDSARRLNPPRWAMELTLCLYFSGDKTCRERLCSIGENLLCSDEDLASHMAGLLRRKRGLYLIPPSSLVDLPEDVQTVACEEFMRLGGVCGCVDKLSHLLSWVSAPVNTSNSSSRFICVNLAEMERVLSTRSQLTSHFQSIKATDQLTQSCLGFIPEGRVSGGNIKKTQTSKSVRKVIKKQRRR